MPCRSQVDLRTWAKPHPVPTHHLACPHLARTTTLASTLHPPLEPGPEPGPCGVCPPLRSRRTNAGSRASDPAGRVCSPHGGEPGRCMAGGLDPDPRTSPITHHPPGHSPHLLSGRWSTRAALTRPLLMNPLWFPESQSASIPSSSIPVFINPSLHQSQSSSPFHHHLTQSHYD
jgi:hypothetical protein